MTFKQIKSISLVSKGLALAALLGFSASLVWAQSDTDNVSRNLAPIGEICLAGQPCSQAPATASTAAPATSAPATSAPATPAPTTAAAAATPEPAPAAAPAAADDFDVAGAYQLRCFACHGTGAAGAPMVGDADAWGERMAKGMDAVMANALNGLGAMPARGLCIDCSDDQIRALITYMADGGQ